MTKSKSAKIQTEHSHFKMVASMSDPASGVDPDLKREIFEHLDVIDNKMANLLQFNSILLATLVFLLSAPGFTPEGLLEVPLFILAFVCVLSSGARCLITIRLTGSHLSKGHDATSYFEFLSSESYNRTRDYSTALAFARIAYLTFIICFGLTLFGSPMLQSLIP